jgi:hypothetical protein
MEAYHHRRRKHSLHIKMLNDQSYTPYSQLHLILVTLQANLDLLLVLINLHLHYTMPLEFHVLTLNCTQEEWTSYTSICSLTLHNPISRISKLSLLEEYGIEH